MKKIFINILTVSVLFLLMSCSVEKLDRTGKDDESQSDNDSVPVQDDGDDDQDNNDGINEADDRTEADSDSDQPDDTHLTSVIYVNKAAAFGGDGSTWEKAFIDLHKAIESSLPGDSIWVAKGIYRPTGNGTGTARSFRLKNDVRILGGFSGDETDEDERDWVNNETVLSGDLNGDNKVNEEAGNIENTEEDALHVFYHQPVLNLTSSAVLDGFTITSGRGDIYGGGMYNNACSPSIRNCVFTGNSSIMGGGMYNTKSSPSIKDCIFKNNEAHRGGGGIYNDNHSSPEIIATKFIRNEAENDGSYFVSGGGGVFNNLSDPILTKVEFIGNEANGGDGGAVVNLDSNAKYQNCDFAGNSARNGGAIYNEGGSPEILNSTINYNYHNNSDKIEGGAGMFNYKSKPIIQNAVFKGNISFVNYGGAMHNKESEVVVNNCVFINNKADQGGAIFNMESNVLLINSTLGFNEAFWGGAVASMKDTSLQITNSIIWENISDPQYDEVVSSDSNVNVEINYSDIKGSRGSGVLWKSEVGTDGGGNIDKDPLFSMNSEHPFTLSDSSPCIDSGTRNPYSYEIENDLLGGERLFGINIDMGAYEYNDVCEHDNCTMEYSTGSCVPFGLTYTCECEDGYVWDYYEKKCRTRKILFVNVNNSANVKQDGTSWAKSFGGLGEAIEKALPGDMIWVAAGKYIPLSFPNGGSTQKESHFALKNGVQIFGGFSGDETVISERDPEVNQTILSGDLNGNDTWNDSEGEWENNEENVYHLFFHPDGVYVDGTAVLDGFILEGGNPENHVINGNAYDMGGAFFVYNGNPTIKNCIFRNNQFGFAVMMMNLSGSFLKISDCKFILNIHGGLNCYGNVEIERSEFVNNISDVDSTAVLLNGSKARIYDSVFSGNIDGTLGLLSRNVLIENTVFSENSSTMKGGAIYSVNDLSMKNVQFIQNSSEKGGAVHSNADLSCENCVFEKNSSIVAGGAVYAEGRENIFKNCTFSENTSQGQGGAVSSLNIHSGNDILFNAANCRFTGNSSLKGGGAVNNNMFVVSRIENSIFENNISEYDGGAVSLTKGLIVGSLFTGNSAVYGGAVSSEEGTEVINCTIAGNSANIGGGFYNMTAVSQIINSIIWGNSSSSSGMEVYSYNDPENENDYIVFRNSDIKGSGGSGAGWSTLLGVDEGGNIDSDPVFTGSGEHPYSLKKVSPCIDSGSNSYIPDEFNFDLAGNNRISGEKIDIGAYEKTDD